MIITETTGYTTNFNWQIGYGYNSMDFSNVLFRATVRPIAGNENYTRIPSPSVLYEKTGISLNKGESVGKWTFDLNTNANLSGGPYRDYQIVIEAHDSNGNTSAGNLVGTSNENGWTANSNGYDIICVKNPRQTGIELGGGIPTQYSIFSGNLYNGQPGTGYFSNSGSVYNSYNYMGVNGDIIIKYNNGIFNSNLAGGYLYVWTGQFPKLETINRSGIYGQVTRSRFNFDPTLGYIHHPTAAVPFRGSSYVYISVSFFDELDSLAIDNGRDISKFLYMSDNAIAYNDVSAGSVSVGGHQTIQSVQYAGSGNPTGILPSNTTVISYSYNNGVSSVLYLSSPIIATGYSNYSGSLNQNAGGMGGKAILLNNNIISAPTVTISCNSMNSFHDLFGNNSTSCSSCCSQINSISVGQSIYFYPSSLNNCLGVISAGNYSNGSSVFNIVQDDPSNWMGSAGSRWGTPFIVTRIS